MAPLIKMCHTPTSQWMHFSGIFFLQQWFNCGKWAWILVLCFHHITVRVSDLLPGKLKLPRDRQQREDKKPLTWKPDRASLNCVSRRNMEWAQLCWVWGPHTVTAAAAGWLIGSNELCSAALAHLILLMIVFDLQLRPSCLLIEPWTLFYISAGVWHLVALG